MTNRFNDAGLTLLELIVALAVGSVALMAAATILRSIQVGERRARQDAKGADCSQLSLWLAEALSSFVALDDSRQIAGDSTSFEFATMAPTGAGWAERREFVLSLSADTLHARARGESGDMVAIGGVARASFSYAWPESHSARWLRQWPSPTFPPVGIRLVCSYTGTPERASDTVMALISP